MSNEHELSQIDEASLVGVWCEYQNFALPHGYLVTDELSLAADKMFVWRQVEFEDPFGSNPNFHFTPVEGRWHFQDGVLKLSIESGRRESVYCPYFEWIEFSVSCRMTDDSRHAGLRQLVLRSSSCGDDNGRRDIDANLYPFEASTYEADENHNTVRERLKKHVKIDGPFKKLIPLLAKEVVHTVGKLELSDPLFCIRLFFYDTHAPAEEYGVTVKCLSDTLRSEVRADPDPVGIPDTLWHPTLGLASEATAGVVEVELTQNAKINDLFQQVYRLMQEAEEENVTKLRAVLRKTAQKLNKSDWPGGVQLTDDFVVFPADGSDHFGGEYIDDLEESVTKRQLAALKKQGYLPS